MYEQLNQRREKCEACFVNIAESSCPTGPISVLLAESSLGQHQLQKKHLQQDTAPFSTDIPHQIFLQLKKSERLIMQEI